MLYCSYTYLGDITSWYAHYLMMYDRFFLCFTFLMLVSQLKPRDSRRFMAAMDQCVSSFGVGEWRHSGLHGYWRILHIPPSSNLRIWVQGGSTCMYLGSVTRGRWFLECPVCLGRDFGGHLCFVLAVFGQREKWLQLGDTFGSNALEGHSECPGYVVNQSIEISVYKV